MATGFEAVALNILNFVNWGITLLVFMLIWEVIQFIRGGETSVSDVTRTGSEWFDKAKSWVGAKGEEKKVKRSARREKTAALNEYVEEKKEVELMKTVAENLNAFFGIVNTGLSKGIDNKKVFVKSYDAVTKALKELTNETSRLKRVTFRSERRTDQLLKDLEEADADDKQLKQARALERDILAQHDQVEQKVKRLAGLNSDISTNVRELEKLSGNTLTLANDVPANLKSIKSGVEAANKELGAAIKAQNQAYKEAEALIAKFKSLWEK